MSEKEFENVIPEAEEVLETVSEEATEKVAEEATEEVAEEVIETAEEAYETAEEVVADGEVTEEELEQVVEEIIASKKKSKAPFIVIAIVVVLAIIAAFVINSFGGNKYNKLGYANPGGRTIADVAEQMGVSLEEFLESYSLPADMPADTEEMNAYYTMPVGVFAEMYGVDFATFKQEYGIPDETTPGVETGIIAKIKALFGGDKIVAIDENTPWGVVLDELALANYVGEENLETFKEYYELGEEVTAETKYKEVRKIVEAKTMELAEEANAAEEAQEGELEEATDNTATTDETSNDGVATTDEVSGTEPVEE